MANDNDLQEGIDFLSRMWYNACKGGETMPNAGKIFENEIKESIPSNIMYYRIKDPAQGFGQGATTRFSLHNQCDALLYKYPNLIAL